MTRILVCMFAVGLVAAPAWPQAEALQKAIVLGTETVYLSADAHSAKVGTLKPGEQIGIQSEARTFSQIYSGISGWIEGHDYVLLSAPNAAEVIFGAAAKFEQEAESAGSTDQTANGAARLYLSVYTFLPSSRRAGEALYRGAAIEWDLKLAEEPTRSSPTFRQFPDDALLRRVESKFKGTPWAARAAFKRIIEHFTCGDWFQKPECIGKEASRYRDYVHKYPQSPDAAEAAFDALYREGIAWTIYSAAGKNQNTDKAGDNKKQVIEGAAQLQQNYPNTDWAARGAYLAFQVTHDSPLALPASTPLGGP